MTMRALHLTAGQAKAICGLSAPEHALQPVPLADGTFIISLSVLADPAHGKHTAILKSLPEINIPDSEARPDLYESDPVKIEAASWRTAEAAK